MGECRFKTKELKRCIEHAMASTEFLSSDEKITEPGFLFVHDAGVYIMSNGQPRDVVEVTEDNETRSHTYVVYAKNCNPAVDEDWWDNAQELVGGNDFAEFIPLGPDPSQLLKLCDDFEEYVIDITDDHIDCFFAGMIPRGGFIRSMMELAAIGSGENRTP